MVKIKNIGIFYFTGTGNTKAVGDIYVEKFREKNIKVEMKAIENYLKLNKKLDLENYDILGLGYPVHAFRAPSIFFQFLNHLPISAEKNVFLFKTMGDPLLFGGSTYKVRKVLEKKGFNVFHEDFLVMPANLLLDYDINLKKQLYDTARRKISLYVNEILNLEKKLQPNSLFLRIISSLFSSLETLGANYFGKFLKRTEDCNLCRKCVKLCPTENISVTNDKLSFGETCIFCLRCVYNCPEMALRNKYFDFLILKKGYDIREVIEMRNSPSEYINSNTKGYFKHFYKYLINELYGYK